MDTADIWPGSRVIITDANGVDHQTTAVTGVQRSGHSFPVVLVNRPLAAGGHDVAPWPVAAVRLA